MQAKTFHIHTYGCQMNKRDSESIAALLARHGWRAAASEAAADLVIVNTCSVRGKAEDKALGKLGLLTSASAKAGGDRRRMVGVMGCMAQRLRERIVEKVPHIDFVVGTRRLAAIPAIVDCVLAGEGPVVDTDEDAAMTEALCGHSNGQVSAFVNILFGCDRRCAYCIVPTVRGREWSRPATSVLEEVGALIASGVRDVTLLGQSVMMYGRRNDVWAGAPPSPRGFTEPLPRLLEAVSDLDGAERVRFTSGHPSGCTPELVRAMASLDAVCEHLHLPVQSGSDRTLERMRRGYSSATYRDAVGRLRRAVPSLALTTDVIVGFPGETEEDFDMTRALMDEMQVDNAFIFKYSARPGTPAAEWPDDVDDSEKMRRNQVLLADQERRGLAINESLVGQTLEVLAEGPSPRNAERWSGRSRANKIVVFPPRDSVRRGDLVQVRIDRAMPQTIYGDVQ